MLVNMSQISTTLAFRHSALPCQTISYTHPCNFSYMSSQLLSVTYWVAPNNRVSNDGQRNSRLVIRDH